ncbi:MAG: hypothetical protein EXR72_23835 [Myxococcales bacterium]|nr:hypothetical protein [Myxococcales bacterium]
MELLTRIVEMLTRLCRRGHPPRESAPESTTTTDYDYVSGGTPFSVKHPGAPSLLTPSSAGDKLASPRIFPTRYEPAWRATKRS